MAEQQAILDFERRQVVYREIPGFPGYLAGDDGAILSCWKNKKISTHWVPLRPGDNGRGYLHVVLRAANGRSRHIYVHRAILLAFIGPCPDGMESRHLNGIKADNRLSNLCYGTHDENAEDNVRLGVSCRGERKTIKLTNAQVADIRRRYAAGGISQLELAAEFGVHGTYISLIVRYKSRVNGYW